MPVGSGIEGLLPDSAFACFVAGQLKTESFRLVDIGCAGGPAPGWLAFGDRLAALCIDGDADEIERLKAVESNPQVRYFAGMVGVPANHPLQAVIFDRHRWTGFGFGRLGYERHHDLRAARAAGREPQGLADYLRHLFANPYGEPALDGDADYTHAFTVYEPTPADIAAAADPANPGPIYLPAFLAALGFDDIDFLKLDIDGPDFEVLRSSTSLLQRPGLLGAALEVCFMGSHDANDNSFHNVDRLMRQKGFDLFALSARPYTSAALPGVYMTDYPSLTLTGRPIQGDAIYLRDLSSSAQSGRAEAVSAEKLAKLAALFSLFNLADHAAEILVVHEQRLAGVIEVPAGLELLTQQIQVDTGWSRASYGDYIAAFEREDRQFFDMYARRETWLAGLVKAAADQPALLQRIAALEAERDRLKVALEAAKAEPAARGWRGLFRRR